MTFLNLCFCLVILHNVVGHDISSFHSSVTEGGRPILRTGPAFPEQLSTPPHPPSQPRTITLKDNDWVELLRTGIALLVREYGYENARPLIKHLVDEFEHLLNVLLHVEVFKSGFSKIIYKVERIKPREPQYSVRSKEDPQWLKSFKKYHKLLFETYGRAEHGFLVPAIKMAEEENNVQINSISTGNIDVEWSEKPREKGVHIYLNATVRSAKT